MLATRPGELRLTLAPERRFELIDVNARLAEQAGDVLHRYPYALYCSPHTTAGYLDQSIVSRLDGEGARVSQFLDSFRSLFPEHAPYHHDRMELRSELTDAQKAVEPRNADSHLTYIGAGLRNCVTYRTRRTAPVYFVDLDGTGGGVRRQRTTIVVPFAEHRIVSRTMVDVPVSTQAIDAVNLADPRLGLLDDIAARLARLGLERGRVDFALDPGERHVGITANEFETLLMRHDLADVLRNPLRFAAVADVQPALSPLMHALRLDETAFERLVAKVTAGPARRFMRHRRVSFPVSVEPGGTTARMIRGTYQSPILVQWHAPAAASRLLEIRIVELS